MKPCLALLLLVTLARGDERTAPRNFFAFLTPKYQYGTTPPQFNSDADAKTTTYVPKAPKDGGDLDPEASKLETIWKANEAKTETNTCPASSGDTGLATLIKERSDLKLPPAYPTNVTAAFLLDRITDVDENNGKATFHVFLCTTWTDPRLAIPCLGNIEHTIPAEMQPSIWMGPELMIPNTFGGGPISQPSLSKAVSLTSIGVVKVYTGFTVSATLTGDYMNWPFDDIICELFITGALSPHQIRMSWVNDTVLFAPTWFQVINFIRLKTVYLPIQSSTYKALPEEDPLRLVNVANSPAWWIFVGLRREWTNVICGIYFPHIIIVCLAWGSLFLAPPPEGVRLSICLSALLVLMVSITSLAGQLPSTGYLKGVDYWLMGHIGIILWLLGGFVVLSRGHHKLDKQIEAIKKEEEEKKKRSESLLKSSISSTPTLPRDLESKGALIHSDETAAEKIARLERSKRRLNKGDNIIRWVVGATYVGVVVGYFYWSARGYASLVVQNRVGRSWS